VSELYEFTLCVSVDLELAVALDFGIGCAFLVSKRFRYDVIVHIAFIHRLTVVVGIRIVFCSRFTVLF
jgi:hypothetical protein